jgi:hypothetical protein
MQNGNIAVLLIYRITDPAPKTSFCAHLVTEPLETKCLIIEGQQASLNFWSVRKAVNKKQTCKAPKNNPHCAPPQSQKQ